MGWGLPLALLAACADNPSEEDAAPAPENTAEAAAAPTSTLPPPSEPVEMAGTAWAANDNDGAVYTTFIDPDGTYRDFRDGEIWQIGSWDKPGGNRICYRPDNSGEDADDARLCWTVRPPGRDGVMTAVDEDGREVVVRQVEYSEPSEDTASE